MKSPHKIACFLLMLPLLGCQSSSDLVLFENEDLNYRFEHPMEWQTTGSDWDPNVVMVQSPETTEKSEDGVTFFDLRINAHEGLSDLPGNPSGLSLVDWVDSSNGYITAISHEPIELNEMHGVEVTTADLVGETQSYFLESGEWVYEIYLSAEGDATDRVIYEEILQSFAPLN